MSCDYTKQINDMKNPLSLKDAKKGLVYYFEDSYGMKDYCIVVDNSEQEKTIQIYLIKSKLFCCAPYEYFNASKYDMVWSMKEI